MITEYSEYPAYDQLFMPVLETYKEWWAITERDAKKWYTRNIIKIIP